MENLEVLADVGFRTSVIYFLMIAGIIILGKNELSQLSIIDLVFILLISNSVQNAMLGENVTLTGGIISGGVLFFWNYVLRALRFRFPRFNRLVQGQPLMLIFNGEIQNKNLQRARLTTDDLMTAIREHGFKELNDIEMVVLETDGNISVIGHSAETQHLKKKKVPLKLKKK